MPVIYHDLQLIQLRMPRTGSTALRNLLQRASDNWQGPDSLPNVEGQHWPLFDPYEELGDIYDYRVWSTRRDFGPWRKSIKRIRQGPPPTFGLFPAWPGMHEAFSGRKRSGDPYYDAYLFLYEYLVRPADGYIPTEALPPLDDRTGKMAPDLRISDPE